MRPAAARPAIIGGGGGAAGETRRRKEAPRNVMHLNIRLRIWGLGVRVSPGAPGLALGANGFWPAGSPAAGLSSGPSHAIPTDGSETAHSRRQRRGRSRTDRTTGKQGYPATKDRRGVGRPADAPLPPISPDTEARRIAGHAPPAGGHGPKTVPPANARSRPKAVLRSCSQAGRDWPKNESAAREMVLGVTATYNFA